MGPWLRLFRIGLLPTACSNILLGMLLENSGTVDAVHIAGGIAIAALLYCFGMGLNDYCDRHRDRTLYPERPLPSPCSSPCP